MKKHIYVMILAMAVAIILPASTFGARPGGEGGTEPFQWQQMNIPPNNDGSASAVFSVPLDSRLVIEYASGNVYCDTGAVAVNFEVWTTAGGVFARHRLPLNPIGISGGWERSYISNQSLILNADSGTDVTVYTACSGTLLGMHAAISGYLTTP